MNYIRHFLHLLKLTIRILIFVLTSILSYALTLTSNNWCEKRRILKTVCIPELLKKLCGKILLVCKITRIIGNEIITYVYLWRNIAEYFLERKTFPNQYNQFFYVIQSTQLHK